MSRKALSEEKQSESLEAKPLIEHLNDLRRLMIFCAAMIGGFFVVMITAFPKHLVELISAPIREMQIEIIYTNVSEAFTAQMQLSLIAAAVIASPFVFFALWRFIRPALYPNERRVFGGLVIAGLFLFVLGVAFAYFMVFRLAINFFVSSGENIAVPMLSLEKYVSFLFSFLLPFGLMFELPIVMIVLARLGILVPAQVAKLRKFVVFIVFIIAAVLTPPDVVSQTLLALPLILLFEIGLLLSRLVRPRVAKD